MKKLFLFLFLIISINSFSQILSSLKWETGDILQKELFPYSLAYTSYSKYPKGYSATIDSSVSRLGNKSLRVEVRSKDSSVGGSKRAEVYYSKLTSTMKNAYWFAWSEYLAADYAKDIYAESHIQFHTESTVGPNWALWLENDVWYVNQKFDSVGKGVMVQRKTKITGNAAPKKGGWDDWVVYFKPSIGKDGVLTVWRNGVMVFTKTGANANKVNGVLEGGRYLKMGIYKWPWSTTTRKYTVTTRVANYDELRIGGINSKLADFILPAKK